MLLAAVELYNALVLGFLDMKYFSFDNVSITVLGVTQTLNLPNLCQNDAKFQTHPPIPSLQNAKSVENRCF